MPRVPFQPDLFDLAAQPGAPAAPLPAVVTAPPGPGDCAPWQLTLAEWLSAPRTWSAPPRPLTVDEWRSLHGYHNPLDEHGDFSHPHGISRATRRRIDQRFRARMASMTAGAAAYDAALAAGAVPVVAPERSLRADGSDGEAALAAARVHHRTCVRRAVAAGLPVPARVLADYPEHGACRA